MVAPWMAASWYLCFSHFADFVQVIIKVSHFAEVEQFINIINHFADFEQVIIKISYFRT